MGYQIVVMGTFGGLTEISAGFYQIMIDNC